VINDPLVPQQPAPGFTPPRISGDVALRIGVDILGCALLGGAVLSTIQPYLGDGASDLTSVGAGIGAVLGALLGSWKRRLRF
jgi:hypothetical protein